MTKTKVTKVELIDARTGEATDITEHVQAISYSFRTYPRGFSLPDVPTDPRTQARLAVALKLVSLRLRASMFGMQHAEAWVQSQLTDDDHAALAKDVTND